MNKGSKGVFPWHFSPGKNPQTPLNPPYGVSLGHYWRSISNAIIYNFLNHRKSLAWPCFYLPGGSIRATRVFGNPFISVSKPFLTLFANSSGVWGRLFPPSNCANVPSWIQDNLHRSFWPIRTVTNCNG